VHRVETPKLEIFTVLDRKRNLYFGASFEEFCWTFTDRSTTDDYIEFLITCVNLFRFPLSAEFNRLTKSKEDCLSYGTLSAVILPVYNSGHFCVIIFGCKKQAMYRVKDCYSGQKFQEIWEERKSPGPFPQC